MHPAFWWLWGALILQRLAELATARRNTRQLRETGGRLFEDDGYGLLVATHVLFFALSAAEAWTAPWAGTGWWTLPGLALLVAGELLRGWSMLLLGGRWTTRVVVLPATPLVAGGPYRFLRHPIYVGVTLTLAGFLLAFGLWGSLAAIVPLNGLAIERRRRREDLALGLAAGA